MSKLPLQHSLQFPEEKLKRGINLGFFSKEGGLSEWGYYQIKEGGAETPLHTMYKNLRCLTIEWG